MDDITNASRCVDLLMQRQDRFGNVVTYNDDSAVSFYCSSIVASDGRELTLGYNPAGNIETVSSGERTWTYGYAGSGNAGA